LTISVPILVRGTDASGAGFVESAHTLVVNLHGTMIALSRRLALDSEVVIENPALHRTAKAVVLWCKQRVTEPSCYEAAVQLEQPLDLWGVNFPSSEKENSPSETKSVAVAPVSEGLPSAAPLESLEAAVPPTEASPIPFVGAQPAEVGLLSTGSQPAETTPPTRVDYAEEQERFKAALKDLSARTFEYVQLLTEAHLKMFNHALSQQALKTTETCVSKLEQSLGDIKRAVLEELRKHAEQELGAFTKRASAEADRLAESVLKTIESKICSIQIRVVPNRTASG
jgi:hypothetical protein